MIPRISGTYPDIYGDNPYRPLGNGKSVYEPHWQWHTPPSWRAVADWDEYRCDGYGRTYLGAQVNALYQVVLYRIHQARHGERRFDKDHWEWCIWRKLGSWV